VPLDELHQLQPTNAYCESKLIVERMPKWFHDIHGFRYASLRYFNAAGALPDCGEAHEPETHLIPLVFSVATGAPGPTSLSSARTMPPWTAPVSATTSTCRIWRMHTCLRLRRYARLAHFMLLAHDLYSAPN
jgi:hypothetical protein